MKFQKKCRSNGFIHLTFIECYYVLSPEDSTVNKTQNPVLMECAFTLLGTIEQGESTVFWVLVISTTKNNKEGKELGALEVGSCHVNVVREDLTGRRH